MSSESWGELFIGLVCLFTAIVLFFAGGRGILKQELHWADNSEYSTGAKGTVRGGSAVGLSFLFVLIGVLALGAAIYFLSALEWHPISRSIFLLVTVLVVLTLGVVTGVLIYRRDIEREKGLKRYKGWVAPSRKPTVDKELEAICRILPLEEEHLEGFWNYNTFFLDTILPALDYMIGEMQNWPEKVGSREEWQKILGDMKEGFELAQLTVFPIPNDDKEWRRILGNMKKGSKLTKLKESSGDKLTENEESKVRRSFDLFKEYFFDLKVKEFDGKLPLEWKEYAKLDYRSFFLDTIPIALDYLLYMDRVHSPDLGNWVKILKQMKDGFAVAQRKKYESLSEEDDEKIGRSFDLFKRYFVHLVD